MILCTLMSLFLHDDWAIRNTGIFHPIVEGYVASSHNHEFVLIDMLDKTMVHYGPDGQLLGLLARKGLGPEEIRAPMMISYQEPYFIVLDYGFLKLFDSNGFVKSLDVETSRMQFPTEFSFVHLQKGNYLPAGATNMLKLSNMDMENPIILHAWELPEQLEADPTRRSLKKDQFTPRAYTINNTSIGKSSRDGKFFYFKQVGTAKILIFDLENKILLRTVELLPRANREIGHMKVDADGNLWVFSQIIGSERRKTYIFDRNGNPTQPRFNREEIGRILKIDANQAYISVYYPDIEDFGIQRCKVHQVKQFIKNHPDTLD